MSAWLPWWRPFQLDSAALLAVASLLLAFSFLIERMDRQRSSALGTAVACVLLGFAAVPAVAFSGTANWREGAAATLLVLALAVFAKNGGTIRWWYSMVPAGAAALLSPAAAAFPVLVLSYAMLIDRKADPRALAVTALRFWPAVLVSIPAIMLHPREPWSLTVVFHGATQAVVGFAARWITLAPLADASGLVLLIVVLGGAWWTATTAATRPVAFGLLWFVAMAVVAPAHPLAATTGIAVSAATAINQYSVNLRMAPSAVRANGAEPRT